MRCCAGRVSSNAASSLGSAGRRRRNLGLAGQPADGPATALGASKVVANAVDRDMADPTHRVLELRTRPHRAYARDERCPGRSPPQPRRHRRQPKEIAPWGRSTAETCRRSPQKGRDRALFPSLITTPTRFRRPSGLVVRVLSARWFASVGSKCPRVRSDRFDRGGERGLVAPLVFNTSGTGTPRPVGSIPATSATTSARGSSPDRNGAHDAGIAAVRSASARRRRCDTAACRDPAPAPPRTILRTWESPDRSSTMSSTRYAAKVNCVVDGRKTSTSSRALTLDDEQVGPVIGERSSVDCGPRAARDAVLLHQRHDLAVFVRALPSDEVAAVTGPTNEIRGRDGGPSARLGPEIDGRDGRGLPGSHAPWATSP